MKDETKEKKQAKLDEIKKEYKEYFDLLVASGGALPLADFSILLEKEYTKTTRDMKKIEQNCNIIKSYERLDESNTGTPRRSKVICLTRFGWRELTGKERNEVKFENERTMDNIKLKAYRYTKLKDKVDTAVKYKDAYIELYGSSVNETQYLVGNQEKVDVEKTLSDEKLIIAMRNTSSNEARYETERVYDIEYIAMYRSLSFKRFLSDLDRMISVFEYEYNKIYDSPELRCENIMNLNIKVTCILRKRTDISQFIHAKNKYKRVYNYYSVKMKDVKWWDSYNFKLYFKNVFKHVKFQLLDDKYNLIDL